MNNPLISQFSQFMQQMRGKNPTAIINQMIASGQLNQNQINQAHQKAQELDKELQEIKKKFGF